MNKYTTLGISFLLAVAISGTPQKLNNYFNEPPRFTVDTISLQGGNTLAVQYLPGCVSFPKFTLGSDGYSVIPPEIHCNLKKTILPTAENGFNGRETIENILNRQRNQ